MTYETKDNSGSLFKNDRKAAETHADYNGSVRIEGGDYWINAWLKESKDGKKFFSLSFKLKDGTSARPEPQSYPKDGSGPLQGATPKPNAGSYRRDLDDDIPF